MSCTMYSVQCNDVQLCHHSCRSVAVPSYAVLVLILVLVVVLVTVLVPCRDAIALCGSGLILHVPYTTVYHEHAHIIYVVD